MAETDALSGSRAGGADRAMCHVPRVPPPTRSTYDNVGRKLVTPDDLAMFLRQLSSDKAAQLPPARLLSMYVAAGRASGPRSEGLGKAICKVVLDNGEWRGCGRSFTWWWRVVCQLVWGGVVHLQGGAGQR